MADNVSVTSAILKGYVDMTEFEKVGPAVNKAAAAIEQGARRIQRAQEQISRYTSGSFDTSIGSTARISRSGSLSGDSYAADTALQLRQQEAAIRAQSAALASRNLVQARENNLLRERNRLLGESRFSGRSGYGGEVLSRISDVAILEDAARQARIDAEEARLARAKAARQSVSAGNYGYNQYGGANDQGLSPQAIYDAKRRAISRALNGIPDTQAGPQYTRLADQLGYSLAPGAGPTNIEQKMKQYAYNANAAQTAAAYGNNGGPGGGSGGYGRGGGSGGFFNDFGTGFRGRQDKPYGEQIGQAVKFSVFYGFAYNALFQITQAFQQSVQEALDFESALVQLNIATGKTREANEDLANSLGSAAAAYGLSPSEGVKIGARSVGLYNLQQAPQAQQEAAALAQTQVAGQLSLLTQQKPEDIQRTLAAISQSFGTGYQGASRIADLDTFLTKRFGGLAGSSLETLSQTGTLGVSAGFSPEMIAAIAAKVQSQTGQTPSAVAGLLSQFFTRAGEGSLQDLFAKYNIDSKGTLFSQVQQLAGVYQGLGGPEQQQFNAAFGRGRSQGAAGVILKNFGAISQAAGEAGTLGQGAAAKAAQDTLNSIPGQIKQLLGAFKELAKEVGESGLLGVIGALAIATKEVVQGLDGVVKVFNLLPAGMREAAFAAVALSAAVLLLNRNSRIAARVGALPLGPGTPGTIYRVGEAGAESVVGGGSTFARLREINAAKGITGIRGAASAAGTLGLAALGGPVGATVLGLTALAIAAGNAKQTLDNIARADTLATDAFGNANQARTADDYKNAAAYATQAAEAQRSARSGFFSFLGSPDQSGKLDTTAAYLQSRAEAIQREQDQAAANQKVSVFGSGSAEDIQAGFDSLTTAGVSAQEQLKLLSEAITGVGAAVDAFKPEEFSSKAVGLLFGITDVTKTGPGVPPGGGKVGGVVPPGYTIQPRVIDLIAGLPAEKRQEAQEAIAAQIAKSPPGQNGFTSEQIQAIAQAGADALGLSPADTAKTAKELYALLAQELANNFSAASATYSPAQAYAAVQANRAKGDAAVSTLPRGSAPGAAIAQLRRVVRNNQRILSNTEGDPTSETLNLITDSKQALAEAELEESGRIRIALQRKAKTSAEIRRIGQQFLRADIKTAVKANDSQALAEIIAAGGNLAIGIARKVINDAIIAARAALRAKQAIAAAVSALSAKINAMDNAINGTSGKDYVGSATSTKAERRAVRDAERTLRDFNNIDSGNPNDPNGYTNPFAGENDAASAADKPSAAQIAAARQTAYATKRGGEVGLARAALATAAADMNKAKKGTLEFYQALATFFAAQEGLREALRAYQLNKALLKIDLTDDVAQARVALRAAERKLRQDRRRGASPDVIAQDRLDVRNAQNTREAAAFNRRLSDAQTAEQLGRITHAAYIKYLNSEHDRLTAIKKRTRQQQDELNQIDLALKAAKEAMSGQFNIGDIKVPTVYEARRFVAAQAGGTTIGGATTINQITISGADTAAVTTLIRQILGPGAIQTASTAPRRG